MEGFKFACGIIAGILMLALAYAATMSGYFAFRRRFAEAKYRIEVSAVVFALFVSVVIKMIIYATGKEFGGYSFEEGVMTLFLPVYSGIGGLAFEGLSEIGNGAVRCLCAGSALYAGLIFVSVITARTNYEVYSKIWMFILRKKKRSVFVFTAANEDSIKLAKSIKKDYAANDKKCTIVFSGPELKAFDRDDVYCREIMANGFFYWSYPKIDAVKKKEGKNPKSEKAKKVDGKSIAKRLKLNNKNLEDCSLRFVVFAFDEKNGIPLEENNSEAVYSDIKDRIRTGDKLRIEYVILTKREINYQAYDRNYRELLIDFAENRKDDVKFDKIKNLMISELGQWIMASKEKKKHLTFSNDLMKGAYDQLLDMFSSQFVISVWDEATETAGRSAKSVMDRIYKEDARKIDRDLSVWTIGFGGMGQAITKALYVQSAYVDKSGIASEYTVEAFDPKMENIDGLFQYAHPMFACMGEKELSDYREDFKKFLEKSEKVCLYDTLRGPFMRCAKNLCLKERAEELKKKYGYSKNLEMSLPTYRLNKLSSMDFNFFRRIDKVTGRVNVEKDDVKKEIGNLKGLSDRATGKIAAVIKNLDDSAISPERPDVFVIATGDDYQNVTIANSLINDVCRERNDSQKRQYIIVHIRDERNNSSLVNANGVWKREEKSGEIYLDLDKLTVFIAGNSNDLYSGSILNYEDCAAYNYHYGKVTGDVSITKEMADCVRNNGENIKAVEKDLEQWLELKRGICEAEDKKTALKEYYLGWFKLDAWLRESNKNIYNFKDYFKSEDLTKDIASLAKIEHQRWMRMHVAYGWVTGTSPTKDELLKKHNCLKPYAEISDDAVFFDVMNVVLSVYIQERDKNKEGK